MSWFNPVGQCRGEDKIWMTNQNAGVNLKMEIGSTWHFHFPAECCSVWFIVMNVWCAKDGDE